jgi:linoleoyl-CoA desaturase
MAIKTLVMMLAYFLPLVLVFYLPANAFIGLMIVVVMGFAKAGIGMNVMHDALHGAYSSKKWVNQLLGTSMYMIGSNVFNWKIHHNIFHHAYTNVDGLDEDIEPRGVIRLSDYTALKSIHRYQHIYSFLLYGLMTFSMLVSDVTKLFRYRRNGLIKKHGASTAHEFMILVFVKSTYLFVMIALPLLITDYAWWQILIGFTIMHWIAGFVMSLVFQLAHIVEGTHQHEYAHSSEVEHEWAVHQMRTTSDFAPNNKLLNWYVGGLNFQVVHHLFPHICHVHYPEIAKIVAKTATEFGIVYNVKPTLSAAIKSHVVRMKELGTTKVLSNTAAFA